MLEGQGEDQKQYDLARLINIVLIIVIKISRNIVIIGLWLGQIAFDKSPS